MTSELEKTVDLNEKVGTASGNNEVRRSNLYRDGVDNDEGDVLLMNNVKDGGGRILKKKEEKIAVLKLKHNRHVKIVKMCWLQRVGLYGKRFVACSDPRCTLHAPATSR
jgi:hypothetical protein